MFLLLLPELSQLEIIEAAASSALLSICVVFLSISYAPSSEPRIVLAFWGIISTWADNELSNQ